MRPDIICFSQGFICVDVCTCLIYYTYIFAPIYSRSDVHILFNLHFKGIKLLFFSSNQTIHFKNKFGVCNVDLRVFWKGGVVLEV